jgi:hypothetical protein
MVADTESKARYRAGNCPLHGDCADPLSLACPPKTRARGVVYFDEPWGSVIQRNFS